MSLVPYTVHGNTGLRIISLGELGEDRKGTITGSVVFETISDNRSLFPRIGDQHPEFPFCHVDSRKWRFPANGFVQMTAGYVGCEQAEGDPDGNSDPVYELRIGTGEEPIETHPDFVDNIGGDPTDPLNGAVFVDAEGVEYHAGHKADSVNTAKFSHFTLATAVGTQNPWAGIEAYLDVNNITWRKSWTTIHRPSELNTPGKVVVPDGPVPEVASNRNWFNGGLEYTERAGGTLFEASQEWRLSGRGGWNSTIYASES